MRYTCTQALLAAWKALADKREFSINSFVCRASQELFKVSGIGAQCIVFAVLDDDQSWQIGTAGRSERLAKQMLSGVIADCWNSNKSIHIVHHKLDTTRFVDPSLSVSISVPLKIVEVFSSSGKAALWFGFGHSVVMTAEIVNRVSIVAAEVREWLTEHASILKAWIELVEERNAAKLRCREVSLLAHDIRAPLNTIMYAMEMDPENSRLLGASLSNELNYATKLLDGLGTAASGESGGDLGSCDPGAVAVKVVTRLRSRSRAKGLDLRCGSLRSGFCVPLSDLACERALSNLVDNSIEHTSSGFVDVQVLLEGTKVVIRVTDSGKGMDVSVVEQLMDAGRSSVTSSRGWGCGLISVKKRLERVGGELVISSIRGKGTIAEMRLPEIHEPDTHQLPISFSSHIDSSNSERNCHVLLIDDDLDQLNSLRRLLEKSGFSCTCETSVAAAFDSIVSTNPQSILCDSNMPDGGARALLARLKEVRIHYRLAVLSGERVDDDLYQLAGFGAEAFFLKPAELGDLVSWLREGSVQVRTGDSLRQVT